MHFKDPSFVELRFQGDPDMKYSIEASTNLVNWEVLGEAVNREGTLEYRDMSAADHSLRFYRVRKLQ